MTTDLESWTNNFISINDDTLRNELRKLSFQINDAKFTQAFGFYGFSEVVARSDLSMIRSLLNVPSDVSNSDLDDIRWRAAFVHRTYAAFVYMRSELMEKGLDSVEDSSPIRPFRDFFRSGPQKSNGDTIAQHIRNSLCHGSFTISSNLIHVEFEDRKWFAKVECQQVYHGLCEQVKRLYLRAFEVTKEMETS